MTQCLYEPAFPPHSLKIFPENNNSRKCLPVLALVCFKLGSELSGLPSGVGATACGILPTETGRVGALRRCGALPGGPGASMRACAAGAAGPVTGKRRVEAETEAEERLGTAEAVVAAVMAAAVAAGIDVKGGCEEPRRRSKREK